MPPDVYPGSSQTRKIPRLLIVRMSAMGDVLHACPAVAALRLALPDTHFGWVIEERWADLVHCAVVSGPSGSRRLVDQVHAVNFQEWRHSLSSRHTITNIIQAVRDVRSPRYDLAIDFQGAVRSSIVTRASGAPSIFGFAEPRENVASMFYTTTVVPGKKHVIEQNLELASAVAGRPLEPGRFHLGSSRTNAVRAIDIPAGCVLLNPGAGWGAKQWPPERYGEVARLLSDQLGCPVLLNVGPGEESLARAAQDASGGIAKPISCSPMELLEVIRRSQLFIGGDTGPLHMAAALGIPVVAIFGPTDPVRTGPFSTRSVVLRSAESRTTRSHERSPDRAMLNISPDDVVRAALQLLGERRG